MKNLIKLHNPGKFLEGSSFGSRFRDIQKLAKQSFLTYFRWFFVEYLPKYDQISANISLVMQYKLMHDMRDDF